MAPHSNTLAWKIPWTEEPGGLQSMGSLESDTTEWLPFHFSLSCIGEGNGSPLQCSCLENPRDGEAWWAAVSGVAQSQTRLKQLSISNSSYERIDWSQGMSRCHLQLPWRLTGKEFACQCRRLGFYPWVREDPLEKEMATHSNILVWRIPWTEKPGELQFMGLQRVRHEWWLNAFSLFTHVSILFQILFPYRLLQNVE